MEVKTVSCLECSAEFQIEKYTIRYKLGHEIQRFPIQKFCSLKCKTDTYYRRYHDTYQKRWLTRPNLWAWKKPRICVICNLSYEPRSPIGETCSRKCARKRWKILNPEHNKRLNKASDKRCRERDPERYRFYTKNRNHHMRVATAGGTTRMFGKTFSLKDWEEIKERFNQCCVICKLGDIKLTIDHMIPISKGGLHNKDNIQPLCGPCNSGKKDKIL